MSLFETPIVFSIVLPPLIFLLLYKLTPKYQTHPSSSPKLPKSYPIFGSFFAIVKNRHRFVQWSSDIATSIPTLTFYLNQNFGLTNIVTANPAVVKHVLKTNFGNYDKGEFFRTSLGDFLGDGIFNSDGEMWKLQRQIAVHEFNTKSLRKFVETVVDSEISGRLIPILQDAAAAEAAAPPLDFQDILHRFAFDNICKIAFGYDPKYLSPSLPTEKFAVAFEKASELSVTRFMMFIPYLWKIKKFLNIGSEKDLKIAVGEVRELALKIIRQKMQEIKENPSSNNQFDDLLSRFLNSVNSDETFVADIVISFIIAGKDTTSVALTWFFWLLSKHPQVENEILTEIDDMSGASSAYEEVKEMVYTHASLCEAMRLYPPVPVDGKAARNDDVLPDGTVVKKGMRVSYHPYAMGRVEKVWGKDWAEFRPERWLERRSPEEKWCFVGRDPYTYPVFQAGPRICLGKDMAFIQMKRIVAAVLRRFRVVPAAEGAEPVLVAALTIKMKDGFPVRIKARNEGI
ncbi:cytochrome P450 94A2-like [Andrographis paniculata]|uniref:cytochrome P450 94A2-like n=1 Tax=Andrographis paniculata TaxID=175694 RepID=UPI0021E72395|nr:cytochrome P450 94A2-like [Andrographis paniculata]